MKILLSQNVFCFSCFKLKSNIHKIHFLNTILYKLCQINVLCKDLHESLTVKQYKNTDLRILIIIFLCFYIILCLFYRVFWCFSLPEKPSRSKKPFNRNISRIKGDNGDVDAKRVINRLILKADRVVLDRDVCKEVQEELLPVFVFWSPESNAGCVSPSVNVRFGRCGLSIYGVSFSSDSRVQVDLI